MASKLRKSERAERLKVVYEIDENGRKSGVPRDHIVFHKDRFIELDGSGKKYRKKSKKKQKQSNAQKYKVEVSFNYKLFLRDWLPLMIAILLIMYYI